MSGSEAPSFRELMGALTSATGDQAGRLIKLEALLEELRRDHEKTEVKIDSCLKEIQEIKQSRAKFIGILAGAASAGGSVGALINKVLGGE